MNIVQAHFNQGIYVPEQYITCLDLNFGWDKQRDLPLFRLRWEQGASVTEIAKEMGREPEEVIILAIDQARRGKIKQRKGGLMGGK